MAATNRRADRPSRTAVVVAFAVAVAAAAALVLVAVFLRNDSSAPPATEAPVVDLSGIPQRGSVLGDPGAPVTLVEYADPQCPGCRAYTETIFPTVVDEYVRPGKIDTEFRGFPFIGEDSVKAYRFLLAAGLQNKLWNLQEAMYRHQGGENEGWVTDDLIRELASAIPGLDVDKLFSDASSPAITQAADGASAMAQEAGIKGTPTLLVRIGDQAPYVIQVADAAQMRVALDDALAG